MTQVIFVTSDLPVPVAPTTAIKGFNGACAILHELNDLIKRNMHGSNDDVEGGVWKLKMLARFVRGYAFPNRH